MAGAKKILLLQERRETLRLRINKRRRWATCPRCKEGVEWLSALEATALSGLSEREIFRLVERDRIHFLETELELLLICPRSLESHRLKTFRS